MSNQTKIALITGGSRGLGRNTAINLARRGVDIVLTYRVDRAAALSAMEQIAGLGRKATVDPDLMEWNYGEYEGVTADTIHATSPDWQIFRDGAPGGETPEQVGARVDRVIARCLAKDARVLGPNGKPFTEDGIGMALGMRDLNKHLRETGAQTFNAGFTKQDRSNFLNALENAIRKAMRGGAS